MELYFDNEGRDKLVSGIKKISRAVKSTLGPLGKTVIIDSPHHTRGLTVTKDGVTVARSIVLDDAVENLAVRMIKDAAERTANSAGDGPQPLTSKVATPYGFKAIGDISVGDKICGTNISEQTVLGVYDKGDLELCEVVFLMEGL